MCYANYYFLTSAMFIVSFSVIFSSRYYPLFSTTVAICIQRFTWNILHTNLQCFKCTKVRSLPMHCIHIPVIKQIILQRVKSEARDSVCFLFFSCDFDWWWTHKIVLSESYCFILHNDNLQQLKLMRNSKVIASNETCFIQFCYGELCPQVRKKGVL